LLKIFQKKILQRATELTEFLGEFFEGFLGDNKTPCKLNFLHFSLQGNNIN